MVTRFSGKVYPNGEFGLARVREVPLSRLCEGSDPSYTLSDDQRFTLHTLHKEGVDVALSCVKAFPPLGLSIRSNSHTPPSVRPRSPRGRKGITSHGAKLIRNSAYLLERKYGKNILSFLTLTLPSMSEELWTEILQHWSEICRILIQKLRRKLIKMKLSPSIFGVVEIQERRMSRYGELALHLHIVFQGRLPRKTWALSVSDAEDIWKSSIIARVPDAAGLYWGASTRLESIKKSCEGYLGKYLSKGKKAVEAIPEELKELLPSAWYICTNNIRKATKQLTRSGTHIGKELLSVIETQKETLIRTLKEIKLPMENGRELTVGWYGRLTSDGQNHFADCDFRSGVGINPY